MATKKSKKISHKDAATSFLQMVIAGKTHEAYTAYVRKEMRHHNVSFAGDAASLEKAMEEDNVQHPRKFIDIKRAVQQGDVVMVHSHVRLEASQPGYATVHIFRFDGDCIAEMWDIIQAVPESSPNKNGMF